MIRSSFILILLTCVVCSFCEKDFVTLGRHSWRCKQRVNYAEQDHSAENTARQTPFMNSPNVVVSSRTVIKCCCGKVCKGARGLKMHQRSCRVIQGLDSEIRTDLEEQNNSDTENIPEMDQSTINETPTVEKEDIASLRKGIKLPKSNSEWSTANEHFKFALQSNDPITSQDLNSNIKLLNNIIYDYVAQNFGYSESVPVNSLLNKYKDYEIKDLKKALKTLKSTNGELDEIKYVSHILRDKLSIICFKRWPFLRTYLTDLIRAVWLSGTIPSEWKKACTILIHKKGDTNTPSNFRPITMETIPLKVFTSCLRNAMYSFLTVNTFIEPNIQKGFTPNMSGTLEHTAQMANIINKARIKQRSLVIILLDLKNAFGEVHHNLITSVLDYHHIPQHVKLIIKSLYTDFQTSIITSEFRTPFIPVRGVFQGDCLSPLLFNMCFNTFIQHIKTDKYRQFGFSLQFLNPIHWFQFANDAAVISSQESENQHLLNRFSIWCQWSNMIIRVDKCSTFGIKKALTKSI
ncbi:Hypothetical predicted protein [Paramuricea clavata]|uniref:Uncharacterized protein n=1 Tax=Paramuricea clavata TaxID=317549 RepID=A0A6S7FZ96_PARCT|nr:Hypothetical predicted protein [Paramuricea clavata]